MISFDEAQDIIAGLKVQCGKTSVPIAEAAGHFLAEDLTAHADFPGAPMSAMDGYAVIDADTSPKNQLRIIGESYPGKPFKGPIQAGEAVRIFTGALLPKNADCVIMQEYVQHEGDTALIGDGYGPARHVRSVGSDFRAGDVLLASGTRLRARTIVSAAAADLAEIPVFTHPTITIIATGDELAPPGEARNRPFSIPESVSFGVAALAQEHGAILAARLSGADDLTTLTAIAGQALSQSDLVIVTGGASVGTRDFAKAMFEPHGLDLLFNKVAIKPGKPVWLGRSCGKFVLGLPGNPTSAIVTARLFLAPLLVKMAGGRTGEAMRWQKLPMAAQLNETGSRETFIRARWADEGLVPISNQDSGAQSALTQSDWLIRCRAGTGAVAKGSVVQAMAF